MLPPQNARYRKLVTIVVEKRGVMQRARARFHHLFRPSAASYTILPSPRSPRPISQSCNHNQLEIIDFLGRPRTRLASPRLSGWRTVRGFPLADGPVASRLKMWKCSRFSRSIEFIFLQYAFVTNGNVNLRDKRGDEGNRLLLLQILIYHRLDFST